MLDGKENRKFADIKTEDGKKERHLLYYDGETVSGKVIFVFFYFINHLQRAFLFIILFTLLCDSLVIIN